MVCDLCGTKLILDNEKNIKCPKCSGITFLDKKESLNVVKKQVDWFGNALVQILNRFEKKRLLLHLLGKREEISSLFFTDAPKVVLTDFLSINVLIKWVPLYHKGEGKKLIDEKIINELINSFSGGYIKVVERYNLILDNFGHIIAKQNLNYGELDCNALISNYIFVINEDWFPIMNTFKEHLIMNEKDANKQLKEFDEEYKEIKNKKIHPKQISPTKTIEQLYPSFLGFLCALNKSAVYKEIFDFRYLKDANIPPEIVFSIVKDFPLKYGIINIVNQREFKKYLKKKFKKQDWGLIYNNLVYHEDNKEIFPFFIKLENNILISICFSKLIELFYYPFYYKDLFDKETNKRAYKFEKKDVPDKLRENGFKVESNIQDKKKSTLEIDTIAWKNDILYVIETKIWDLKPLFEHKFVHDNMERDLKGVVDGKEYTTRGRELIVKDRPSLISKIEHVKNNINFLCVDCQKIKQIKGLIIVNRYPPITVYKSVKMIAFNDINKL